MYRYRKLTDKNEFFKTSDERGGEYIYKAQIIKYGEDLTEFLKKYISAVKKNGVYIKGKIPNPDMRQLEFYREIMGDGFKCDRAFIAEGLDKWLPQCNAQKKSVLAQALYDMLVKLSQNGKTEAMLKNTYIKYICWFYYKFSRVLQPPYGSDVMKILYEGAISQNELALIEIISLIGCDVLIVDFDGKNILENTAVIIKAEKPSALPKDFKLEAIGLNTNKTNTAHTESGNIRIKINRPDRAAAQENMRIKIAPHEGRQTVPIKQPQPEKTKNTEIRYMFPKPDNIPCINAWISGDVLGCVLMAHEQRGNKKNYCYSVFAELDGVWNKGTYTGDIFKWYKKLLEDKRSVVVEENVIPMPDNIEISKSGASHYADENSLVNGLCRLAVFAKCPELEKLIKKAVFEILTENNMRFQRMTNSGITLLCWINRYIPKLFKDWKLKSCPVFVYFGKVGNEREKLFLKLLSRIGVDVVILTPEREYATKIEDKFIFIQENDESLSDLRFPFQKNGAGFTTAAYNASRELDETLYSDSGFYREKQFCRAETVNLKTTADEIWILWKNEAKYRDGFSVNGNKVIEPVIFAKICGVHGDINEYWEKAAELAEGAFVIKGLPFIKRTDENPIKRYAAGFYKNGQLQRNKIITSPGYQYGFIRREMQEYMLDKLEMLIKSDLIDGNGRNGMEYTIISTVLNLDREILRKIQNYDFTKTVPKLLIITTHEEEATVEDSIMTAYLNLIGFDVVILAPTGYQTIERYYTHDIIEIHNEGDYKYDLTIPDFANIKCRSTGIFGKLFGARK